MKRSSKKLKSTPKSLGVVALEAVKGSTDFKTSALVLRSALSTHMMSQGPFHFELSGYSRLATTAGSVLQLTDYAANPRIPMCISTGGVDYSTDFTYLTGLFDQIIVYGLTVHYEPANPYNRGVSTISYPCYVAYDNDALITPTTSVAGLRAQSERGSYFKMFSPDHSMSWHVTRPGWKGASNTNYPWADINSIGTSTETSVLGSMFFGSDGTLTASTTYGAVRHIYHVVVQMRF